jgi:hypothetical protein
MLIRHGETTNLLHTILTPFCENPVAENRCERLKEAIWTENGPIISSLNDIEVTHSWPDFSEQTLGYPNNPKVPELV